MGSEFGDMFQEASGILHGMLGDSTATVTYTPPSTDTTPGECDEQTLTEPIISDLEVTEPDQAGQQGQQQRIAKSITVKYSEISRFSNKGKITINGVEYPILNYVLDEDAGELHIELNHMKRVNVSGPNFIRPV